MNQLHSFYFKHSAEPAIDQATTWTKSDLLSLKPIITSCSRTSWKLGGTPTKMNSWTCLRSCNKAFGLRKQEFSFGFIDRASGCHRGSGVCEGPSDLDPVISRPEHLWKEMDYDESQKSKKSFKSNVKVGKELTRMQKLGLTSGFLHLILISALFLCLNTEE